MRRVHVYVSGLVQGVFFRAKTRDKASSLGLSGWVANLPDGRVEILAEGPAHSVETFIAWCHQGPMLARVTAVDVHEEAVSGEWSGFEIRR